MLILASARLILTYSSHEFAEKCEEKVIQKPSDNEDTSEMKICADYGMV